MPIEIQELVVRGTVSQNTGIDEAMGQEYSDVLQNQSSNEPLERAVQEVLDLIKRKNER